MKCPFNYKSDEIAFFFDFFKQSLKNESFLPLESQVSFLAGIYILIPFNLIFNKEKNVETLRETLLIFKRNTKYE